MKRKTRHSRLLDGSEDVEDIVIARAGKPAVRLVPNGNDSPGKIGLFKGKITVPDNFDVPLPDDLLDIVEGKAY